MESARLSPNEEVSSKTYESRRCALDIIEALRDLFLRHFDNGWFTTILERYSFERRHLNDIYRLLELRSLSPGDYFKLRDGIRALIEFVTFNRRCIMPVLRDELGLSGFAASMKHSAGKEDDTTRVVKSFFVYTFPANLEQLAELTDHLRECTDAFVSGW